VQKKPAHEHSPERPERDEEHETDTAGQDYEDPFFLQRRFSHLCCHQDNAAHAFLARLIV
jgi:hypothetical protein